MNKMVREDTLPEEQSIIPRGDGRLVDPNYRRDLNEALKRREESARLKHYEIFGGKN
jgi:hypothetical protein